MQSSGRERWYAEAERRLGRKLGPSERVIDIEGATDDMERGKARLARAIAKEQRRLVAEVLKGKRQARLQITPEMEAALLALRRAGKRHARREIRELGIERQFAEEDDIDAEALRGLLKVLRQFLSGLTRKVRERVEIRLNRERQIDVVLSTQVQRAIARQMERRVPGSLDIASRLVSTAFTGGLGSVYEQHTDAFPCWIYTAVMDGATCAVCRRYDGKVYASWAAIMAVLPDGGPNPACLGDGRCRCRVVPCPPEGMSLRPSEMLVPGQGRDPRIGEKIEALDRAVKLPRDTQAIDLHLLPTSEAGLGEDTTGQLSAHLLTGPQSITLTTDTPGIGYSLWHEYAHVLDLLAGKADEDAWRFLSVRGAEERSGKLYDFLLAAISSPTLQEIVRIRARYITAWGESDGDERDRFAEIIEMLNYYLSPEEVWARAFAQWMVARAGDDDDRAHLDDRRTGEYMATQWQDDEFGPIARAIEAYLRDQGWLR